MGRKLGIWSNLVQVVGTYTPQEYFDMHCLKPPYMAFLELLCTGDHFIVTYKNWVKELCAIASDYPKVDVAILLGFNHEDEQQWIHAEQLLDELEGLPSVKYCGVMGEYVRDEHNNSVLTPASLLRMHNLALSYGWIPTSYYISNKVAANDIPTGHKQIGHTNWPCSNSGAMEVECFWHIDQGIHIGQSRGLWEFHVFPSEDVVVPPIEDYVRGNWHWNQEILRRCIANFAATEHPTNGKPVTDDVRQACILATGFDSPSGTAGDAEYFTGISGKTTAHISDHPTFRQWLVEEVDKYPGVFTPAIDTTPPEPEPKVKKLGVQMNEYAGYVGSTVDSWFPVMMNKIGPKIFFWNTVWTSTTRSDRDGRISVITADVNATLNMAKSYGVEYILRFGNAADPELGLGQQLQDEINTLLSSLDQQVDWLVLGTEWCQIKQEEYGDILDNLEAFRQIALAHGAKFGIYQVVGKEWLNETNVPGIRDWVLGRHSNFPHTDNPPLKNNTPSIWMIDDDPNVFFHADGYDAGGVEDEWVTPMTLPNGDVVHPLKRLFEHAEGRWIDAYGNQRNYGPVENLEALFVLFIDRDRSMLDDNAFCNELVTLADEYGYERYGGDDEMPYGPAESPIVTITVTEANKTPVITVDNDTLSGDQPYTAPISGYIRNPDTNNGLGGRTLTLHINDIGVDSTISATDGRYSFNHIIDSLGVFTAQVKYAGD